MNKELLLIVLMVIIGFAIAQSIEFSVPVEPPPEPLDSGSRLSQLLGSNDMEGYARAIDPRTFHFPEDHGPHPEYRNEWWYITGNLADEDGRRFGFEFTVFRFALTPTRRVSISDWQSNQVFIAHFAVTDVAADQILVAQRFSRDAMGLAGAEAAPFAVWIEDWSVRALQLDDGAGFEHWEMTASEHNFSLELNLVAEKPPTLNGIDGLSQKSAAAGNASYYYSISRMASSGTLRIDDEIFDVSGLSWLDREWGSSALGNDQQGWDWFALQLSDGSDLMFYNIRKKDGSQDTHSAGTWIDASGTAHFLSKDDVLLVETGTWESPNGGTYPSGWELRVPAQNLAISVKPVIRNQELSTTVRYWEGAVDVSGQHNHGPVTGHGYVELTGYAR